MEDEPRDAKKKGSKRLQKLKKSVEKLEDKVSEFYSGKGGANTKDMDEVALWLELLKMEIQKQEREIADLRCDPVAHEAVDKAYRRWERERSTKMDADGSDPPRQLARLLMLAGLKTRLKDAKEAIRPAAEKPASANKELDQRILRFLSRAGKSSYTLRTRPSPISWTPTSRMFKRRSWSC